MTGCSFRLFGFVLVLNRREALWLWMYCVNPQVGSWGSNVCDVLLCTESSIFLFNSLGRVTHGITVGLVNHVPWGSNPDGVKLLT